MANSLSRRSQAASSTSASDMLALRDAFWNNVVRDMLNGLAVLAQQQPELFDGRFAVLTHHGERIPIAAVTPIFACSIPGSRPERDASVAVQCTIFRIQTPGGEVFTLPIHEIRALHTMTPELLEQLQKASGDDEDDDGPPPHTEGRNTKPFGFAAYTALPKPIIDPAPDHPTE